MKAKILFLLFLGLNYLHAQDTIWNEYAIDTLITISMPGDPQFINQPTEEGENIQEIITNPGNALFSIKRLPLNTNKTSPLYIYPHNKGSLIDFYRAVVSQAAEATDLKLHSKRKTTYKGLIGYTWQYNNKEKQPAIITTAYLLNNNIYIFQYHTNGYYIESDKNKFFNSMEIHSPKEVDQYPGKLAKNETEYVVMSIITKSTRCYIYHRIGNYYHKIYLGSVKIQETKRIRIIH